MNKMEKIFLTGVLTVLITLGALVASFGGSYISAPSELTLGAIPGNEVQGNQFIIGGVKHYSFHYAMVATSSNVCTILTPSATTTFVNANAGTRMNTKNLVASIVSRLSIAVGANNWATTTELGTVPINTGQNGEISVLASTTAANAYRVNLIAPNSYVNFGVQGTSTNNIGLAGFCNLNLVGVE